LKITLIIIGRIILLLEILILTIIIIIPELRK